MIRDQIFRNYGLTAVKCHGLADSYGKQPVNPVSKELKEIQQFQTSKNHIKLWENEGALASRRLMDRQKFLCFLLR